MGPASGCKSCKRPKSNSHLTESDYEFSQMAVLCYNTATKTFDLGDYMKNETCPLKFTTACFTGPRFLRNQYSFETLHSEETYSHTSYNHSSHSLFYRPENLNRDLIDRLTSSTGTFRLKANEVKKIYSNKNSSMSFLLMSAISAESHGSFVIRPDYKVYDSVMLAVGTLRGSKKYGYDTSVCSDVGVIVGGVNEVWDNDLQADVYRLLVVTGTVDQVNGVCKFLESTGATQIARFMIGPLVILPNGTDDDMIRQEKDKMESIMRWVSDGPCSWLGANLFWHDHDCECFNCSESTKSSATIV